jgi:hypothetical protein
MRELRLQRRQASEQLGKLHGRRQEACASSLEQQLQEMEAEDGGEEMSLCSKCTHSEPQLIVSRDFTLGYPIKKERILPIPQKAGTGQEGLF